MTKDEYNQLPWWEKLPLIFPTGFAAKNRADLINGKNPTHNKESAITAFLIIALLVAALITTIVLGAGLGAAGASMTALIPTITTCCGLAGGAAFFIFKSINNEKSLKKNLTLATNRDKIINANTQYKNKVTDKKIDLRNAKNTTITEARLNKIFEKAKKHFPDSSRLQTIYIGAQLLKCYTSKKVEEENNKHSTEGNSKFSIEDQFNKTFSLNPVNENKVKLQDKNDALLACVARHKHQLVGGAKKMLKSTIQDASKAFYNCDVSDNVVNIALNDTFESCYNKLDDLSFHKNFYDADQSDKFASRVSEGSVDDLKKADIFDKEMGIQKTDMLSEVVGSTIASLPIWTAFVNVGKVKSITNGITNVASTNSEIDSLLRSQSVFKKIELNFASLDFNGDGIVTLDEMASYANREYITKADVENWLKLYSIDTTKGFTMESLLLNKALGKGFATLYYQNLLPTNTKSFDSLVKSFFSDDAKSFNIIFNNGSAEVTVSLDENDLKRFAKEFGMKCTDANKTEFARLVLSKYKVFAEEIKVAMEYKGDTNGAGGGFQNYINGLKKLYQFPSSEYFTSASITTTLPEERSEAEWTSYEEMFFKRIPAACKMARSVGNEHQSVKEILDLMFRNSEVKGFTHLFFKNNIFGDVKMEDFENLLCHVGPGAIDYIENFSKYMYYQVQPGDEAVKKADESLKALNVSLDKMFNEKPGKSYIEEYVRTAYNKSLGNGDVDKALAEFRMKLSDIPKAAGKLVKIINDAKGTDILNGLLKLVWTPPVYSTKGCFSGKESQVTRAATTSTSTVWSNSNSPVSFKTLTSDQDAPVKVDTSIVVAENDIEYMNNVGAIGLGTGLGAAALGVGILGYEKTVNDKKHESHILAIKGEKNARMKKNDDLLSRIIVTTNQSAPPASPVQQASKPSSQKRRLNFSEKKPLSRTGTSNPYLDAPRQERISPSDNHNEGALLRVARRETPRSASSDHNKSNLSNLSGGGIGNRI